MSRQNMSNVTFQMDARPTELPYARVESMQIDNTDVWLDPDVHSHEETTLLSMGLPSDFAHHVLTFARDHIRGLDVALQSPTSAAYYCHSFAQAVGRTVAREPVFRDADLELPLANSQLHADTIMQKGRGIRQPRMGEWAVVGNRQRNYAVHSAVGLGGDQMIQVRGKHGYLYVGHAQETIDHYQAIHDDPVKLYAYRRFKQLLNAAVSPLVTEP